MADQLLKTAEGHLEAEDDDKALEVAEEAAAKFREAKDLSGLAEALRLQINALIAQGDRTTAVQVANDNLATFSSHRLGKAKLLLGIAEASCEKCGSDHREKALTAADDARSLFEAEGEKVMQGNAEIVIANSLTQKGSFEAALVAANKAKALYIAAGHKRGEGVAEHCRAVVCSKTLDVEECLRAVNLSIACFEAVGLVAMQAFEQICLAKWTLELESKPKKALQLCEKAQAFCQKSAPKLAYMALGIAVECLLSLARSDNSSFGCMVFVSKAIRVAQEGVDYFESIGDKTSEAFARESLAVASASMSSGDASSAIERAISAANAFSDITNRTKELQMRQLAAGLQFKNRNFVEAGRIAQSISDVATDVLGQLRALEICFKVDIRNQRISQAKDIAKKMISLTNKAKDKHGEAMAKILLSEAHFMDEEHAVAVSIAREAQAMLHDLQDVKGEAGATKLIAKIHFDAFELEFALRAALKQRSLLRDSGDLKAIAEASLLCADIRMELMLNLDDRTSSENFTQMFFDLLDSVKDAKFLGKKIDDKRIVASVLALMAQAYTMVSEVADALSFCEEAAPIFREFQDDAALSSLYLTEAEAWFVGGEVANATRTCNRALKIFQERGDSAGVERAEALLLRFNPPKPKQVAKAVEDKPDSAVAAIAAMVPAKPKKEEAAGGDYKVYESKGITLDMASANRDALRAVLYDVVQSTVGVELDFLEDDLPLMQAGIASRTAVTMRASLEQSIPGIQFPATLVFDFPSINAVMDFVEESL